MTGSFRPQPVTPGPGRSVLPEVLHQFATSVSALCGSEVADALTEWFALRRAFEPQAGPHVEIGAVVKEVLGARQRLWALVEQHVDEPIDLVVERFWLAEADVPIGGLTRLLRDQLSQHSS